MDLKAAELMLFRLALWMSIHDPVFGNSTFAHARSQTWDVCHSARNNFSPLIMCLRYTTTNIFLGSHAIVRFSTATTQLKYLLNINLSLLNKDFFNFSTNPCYFKYPTLNLMGWTIYFLVVILNLTNMYRRSL